MMKKRIRLLLVEDDRPVRSGIVEILKPHKDIKVVAASSNRENAWLEIQKLNPNVVLVDLGIRNQSSLEVVSIVKQKFPESRVIVMDLAPAPSDIELFVEAGASGFILRDATAEQLILTIREVADGKSVLPQLTPLSLIGQIIGNAQRKASVKNTPPST